MDTKLLEEIGLTKIESQVYIELLKLGSSTAWPLIKKTELHKSTVYNVLERLIEKGLVSFIKEGKKRFFEAAEPLTLMSELEKKEKEVEKTKEELNLFIRELQTIKKTTRHKEGEIFHGKAGIKAAYEKILAEGKTIYGTITGGKFQQMLPIYFEQWHKKRIKHAIKVKVISSERSRARREQYLKGYWGMEVRSIPISDLSTNTIICGDKVMFIAWSEQPVVIFIHSQEMAKNQMDFFWYLWNNAKKES